MLRLLCVLFSLFLLSLLALPIARAAPFFAGDVDLAGTMSLSWDPEQGHFGLFLSLLGSLELVLLSLPCSAIVAWGVTYQLVHSRSPRLKAAVVAVLDAGNSVPSVVIGIWGIAQLTPLARAVDGTGYCLVTAAAALAVLGLPTMVILLRQSYQAYLGQYRGLERSMRFSWLDSTRFFVTAAKAELRHVGLYSFCRIFGETTVVLMLSGNSVLPASGLFDGFRTLTSTIALEMAYATERHESALYVLAAVSVVWLAAAITLSSKEGRDHAASPA